MLSSEFHGRGYYAQLAYALALDAGPLHKVTPYARYEQRHAWFEGFTPITVERVTADPSLHTPDLGGKATTKQVTEAVCEELRKAND